MKSRMNSLRHRNRSHPSQTRVCFNGERVACDRGSSNPHPAQDTPTLPRHPFKGFKTRDWLIVPFTPLSLSGGRLLVFSVPEEGCELSAAQRLLGATGHIMAPIGGTSKTKKGILERLDAGEIVIGDGGFVIALEKRGYVKAGPWTPEATVEHPEAVRQLHREFLRAGANVLQTFTFYATDDKLENRGNYVADKISGHKVNEAACDIAKEVAQEGDALVAGGVSQTPSYLSGKGEAEVKKSFRKQLDVFTKNNVDFLIAEYFEHVEEAVWAVETLKESGMPVAVTLCIGPEGDMHGVLPGECAVRLVKAGASIVGVNCHFDPATCLKTVKLMKEGLAAAKLKAHLMSQPLAFHTPDCGKQGFIDLPEFPFGLEPRILTRWDVHKYAREAYNLGIRYIGGCCGFEPYHIRAIAEELAPERGFLPRASEKHGNWGSDLSMHTKPWVRARARKEYWENLLPASGRPYCPSLSKPDDWGVTKGDAELLQQKEATTEQQLKELFGKQKLKSKVV